MYMIIVETSRWIYYIMGYF